VELPNSSENENEFEEVSRCIRVRGQRRKEEVVKRSGWSEVSELSGREEKGPETKLSVFDELLHNLRSSVIEKSFEKPWDFRKILQLSRLQFQRRSRSPMSQPRRTS
jgi:hypothetical protein